jgi:hypothetical protein
MKIYEHMESHLGPIVRGWGPPDDTLGIQVSLFAHTPEQDLNTFCTLGLSKHILSIGQKKVRQELLFSVPARYSADAIASFLLTFAESIARSHHGLLRGAVVEGRPLIEGVAATGIYASIPVFWPDELQVFEDSSPKTVFVWLLPLVGKVEADVIASKGWNYFEDYLEGAEIDFWDLNRPPLF